jgi:hypothetical protein
LGRPPWGRWAHLGFEQGGRHDVRGRSTAGLANSCSSCVAGKVHLARRSWLRHNTSLKRSAIGRPAGPGLKCRAHVLRSGPSVLPLSSA